MTQPNRSFHIKVENFSDPQKESTFHRLMLDIDRDWPYCLALNDNVEAKELICGGCKGRVWRNPNPSVILDARELVEGVLRQLDPQARCDIIICHGSLIKPTPPVVLYKETLIREEMYLGC